MRIPMQYGTRALDGMSERAPRDRGSSRRTPPRRRSWTAFAVGLAIGAALVSGVAAAEEMHEADRPPGVESTLVRFAGSHGAASAERVVKSERIHPGTPGRQVKFG